MPSSACKKKGRDHVRRTCSRRRLPVSPAPLTGPAPTTSARRAPPSVFFFNDTATTEIYTLSLHDALPIFWEAEHHFQHEGYECIPNLIQWGLWLATQTKRLKFGCGFNILPMWHPVRLAEDYAMADIVTDGRIIMGVG